MFGTSGIRGAVGETVTASLGVDLGRAVAADGAERVVLGRDPRDSGDLLADAVAAGLRESGVDVLDLGLAATPTVARAVGWRNADAGVAVTASHNPPQDNGFKLWNPSGQAFTEAQRERIADRLEDQAFDPAGWDDLGVRTSWPDAADRHVEAIVDAVDLADPLSVVVDVGTGAGQVTAEALEQLDCDVETLNAQPDGSFPARPSEPTAEHCEGLARYVGATDADLGVAHDGDADRTKAVDATGSFLAGDRLLALFARDAASEGERVAIPVDTSLAVEDALDAVGVGVTRTRVGDVFVAEVAAEPDVAFGGEPSGAWIWPGETLCPDGPLAACKLAALVDERGPLADQVSDLPTYPIRRANVRTEDKRDAMARVEEALLAEYDDVTTIDGVRVETAEGWFLVRASGTQPLIRVTAEARDESRADELLETARGYVEAQT
ncbi:phosphoglucosamine mutase [Halobacteriales archaeon QS_1_68_20]|nr:MAG: phosphoglucosamine mutase [Halobacteriales archaeon QS_1_68_20]